MTAYAGYAKIAYIQQLGGEMGLVKKILGYTLFALCMGVLVLLICANYKVEREQVAACQKENPGARCEMGAHPIEAQ